jgi:hypothetical protein
MLTLSRHQMRWRRGVTLNRLTAQPLHSNGIYCGPAIYAESVMAITDRNAGYDGLKLGGTNLLA